MFWHVNWQVYAFISLTIFAQSDLFWKHQRLTPRFIQSAMSELWAAACAAWVSGLPVPTGKACCTAYGGRLEAYLQRLHEDKFPIAIAEIGSRGIDEFVLNFEQLRSNRPTGLLKWVTDGKGFPLVCSKHLLTRLQEIKSWWSLNNITLLCRHPEDVHS